MQKPIMACNLMDSESNLVNIVVSAVLRELRCRPSTTSSYCKGRGLGGGKRGRGLAHGVIEAMDYGFCHGHATCTSTGKLQGIMAHISRNMSVFVG